MPKASLQQRVARNAYHTCDVSGCTRRRKGLSNRDISDGLRLTYALGHAVLRLAPRETTTSYANGRTSRLKRVAPSHRHIIGERIRLTLAGLLANIELGLERKAAAQRAWEESLRVPFNVA
jgi:hypothetical protein